MNNVKFGIENATKDEVIKACKTAAIHNEISNFEKGYDTILGERGINLSGGQKQRISIARALIKKPKILILDDCLSAVDTETENRILERLQEKSSDQTTVIVSHRISTIRNAEKIIVIDQGEMIEEGSHESLLKNKGFYFDMYQQQLSEESNDKDED